MTHQTPKSTSDAEKNSLIVPKQKANKRANPAKQKANKRINPPTPSNSPKPTSRVVLNPTYNTRSTAQKTPQNSTSGASLDPPRKESTAISRTQGSNQSGPPKNTGEESQNLPTQKWIHNTANPTQGIKLYVHTKFSNSKPPLNHSKEGTKTKFKKTKPPNPHSKKKQIITPQD